VVASDTDSIYVKMAPLVEKVCKGKSIPQIVDFLDKASEDNERNYLKLKNSNGDMLIVVQIAGMIARRIVCDVKVGDAIKQGDRFGMIRFGSKVDLYFENYQLMVQQHQTTIGGETILAKRK